MRKLSRLSLLGLSTALTACNFAPHYETPAFPVASHYKQQGMTDKTGADLHWQTFFKDPRLLALIDLGLKNNHDLLLASKNVEIAKKQYGIQFNEIFPQIGANASQSAQNLPADMNARGMRDINRSYIAGIGISNYEIDFFGKIRNQSEAALQAYFATEQAQRTAQLSLVSGVANAYFTVRLFEEMDALVTQTLSAYQQTYQMIQARFNAGIASAVDLQQAKMSLESAKASLAETKRNKEKAINALELLIAQPLPADLPPASPFGSDVLMEDIPVGLPSDLLTRRPDIMAAEHQLKAANANIGAARAAFFPSIRLTALLGVASLDLSQLFESGRDAWTFSPSVSLPIYAFGSLKNNLDIAHLRKEIHISQYEKTIQTAFAEVNDALYGVQTYKQQLTALRAQTTAAEQSLNLSMLRYRSGIDHFLAVQSAQISVLSIKQNFLSVGLASLQNKIALYKALGGGWSSTEKGNK